MRATWCQVVVQAVINQIRYHLLFALLSLYKMDRNRTDHYFLGMSSLLFREGRPAIRTHTQVYTAYTI